MIWKIPGRDRKKIDSSDVGKKSWKMALKIIISRYIKRNMIIRNGVLVQNPEWSI